jgi:hypothetical protein
MPPPRLPCDEPGRTPLYRIAVGLRVRADRGTPEAECRYREMPAIDPPILLDGYPNEPINSTEAAAKFIERHDGGFDIEGTNLVDVLRRADTQASGDAACQAFRQWAENCGLLSDATADSPA